MGVRFACHSCGKRLHVKNELAGKRGVCPDCHARFRVPDQDADQSLELESEVLEPARAGERLPQAKDAPSNAPAARNPAVASPPAATPARPESTRPTTPVPPASPQREGVRGLAPEATWYVRPPTGGQYGPASSEVLEQWIGEGRIAASALVWRDGWAQWREAREVLGAYGLMLTGASEASRSPAASPEEQPPKTAPATVESKASEGHQVGQEMRGDVTVGRGRRLRSQRRIVLVSVLSVLSLVLIILLIVVASR